MVPKIGLLVLVLIWSVLMTCRADAELSGSTNSTKTETLPPNSLREVYKNGKTTDRMYTSQKTSATSPETSDSDEGNVGRLVEKPTVTSPPKTIPSSTSVQVDDGLETENIPPHVTNPLSNEMVIVSDFKTLSLCCEADGSPTPSIEWLRDGVLVDSTLDYLSVTADGCLRSDQFSHRENGWFQCRASNKYGVSLSQMIFITAEVHANTSDAFKTDEQRRVAAGTDFALSCGNPPPTLPPTQKRWYMDEANQIRLSERVAQDSTGTLHFSFVKEEDESNYLCGLVPGTDNTASKIILYNRGSIRVTGSSSSAPKFRPNIQYATYEVKATMFQDVMLECYFGGNPVPTMSWLNRSNHEISTQSGKYSLDDYGRRLTIHHVVQADNGTYTCSARNFKETVPITLHVTVVSPPLAKEDKILVPTTVPDNGDVTLSCQTWAALGLTMDRPQWFRNGQPLTGANRPDPSRYSFSSDHTQLTIQQLNKETDTAAYQCNVTNSMGYLFMDGYLRVIESIEITKKPAEVIVVDLEEPKEFDLTVMGKGDHCCDLDFLWSLNGSSYGFSSPLFSFDSNTNELVMNTSSVDTDTLYSAMGSYRCQVSNRYQRVDVEFKLQMAKDPSEVTDDPASSGSDLWWLGIVFGVLALLVMVVIIIVVRKGYYPGSTYMLEKTELKHNLNPQEDLLNQSFQEI